MQKIFLSLLFASSLTLPVMAAKPVALKAVAPKVVAAAPAEDKSKGDGLKHFIVIWVQDKTKEVEDPLQDDIYHTGEKLPAKEPGKKHKETVRIVSAKEFVTDAEANKFIADAPGDVRKRMHKLSEDE